MKIVVPIWVNVYIYIVHISIFHNYVYIYLYLYIYIYHLDSYSCNFIWPFLGKQRAPCLPNHWRPPDVKRVFDNFKDLRQREVDNTPLGMVWMPLPQVSLGREAGWLCRNVLRKPRTRPGHFWFFRLGLEHIHYVPIQGLVEFLHVS